MHVIFRESHGLEETATPTDLGQTPADLVVLSFSDSDLGAFAAGWARGRDGLPSLRLANLAALTHPLSVDTYVEDTLSGARGILIRLIGGAGYWAYGLQQVQALARQKGLALAVLPADGRPDPALDAASTLPVSTLRRLQHLCETGGAVSAQAALQQLALAAGLYAAPVRGARGVAQVGGWTADGVSCPAAFALGSTRPRVALTFYRSYMAAADLDPVRALAQALDAQGFDVLGLFVPSLKDPQARAWLARWIGVLAPQAVLNATAFSAQGAGDGAVLEAAGVPVFQVALATNDRKRWLDAERGLSPSDLAMHVVLPEVDGRLFAGVVSFKEFAPPDPDLQFARAGHRADISRVRAIAARIAGWVRLGARPAGQRRLALVLSTYPGKGWNMAHAVGLDALASADAILADLAQAGYDVPPDAGGDAGIGQALPSARIYWPLAAYQAALAALPETLRNDLNAAWGNPANDPACTGGSFEFAALRRGNALVALQPERGTPQTRDDDYHDLSRVPRHAYVAFYLWLREQVDALVHIGAHGTLEWLPGKSVALSDDCWPEALVRDLPVIYPFIVNDPGEAAQAKRRIGAVTLGHVPPPMIAAQSGTGMVRLEALLDEFSNADGLDPARRDRLQASIRDEAEALGLGAELGLERASCLNEAISRIDRFVCDIKESQFGEGLHVFGRGEQGAAERAGLLAALSGRFVPAGPSGSPHRGRQDVLPTGRNMFTTDPRAVPTRAAFAQGVRLADELVRRHLQDHGDWPRALVLDLWGSATMRTAGEEFAMALHLLGARPVWDAGSERVSGVEILPIAELDRPRLDVTLRVSGLFRDVFPQLATLFGQAVQALAGRDEAPDWNPFVGKTGARVYGPAPGNYGLGMGQALENYTDAARLEAGRAWLAASSHAMDTGASDPEGIAARVAGADAFVHLQDLPETDLLLAQDYAAHEAGFAAAQSVTGGKAALYHIDSTNPDTPHARPLHEEIARVVRARAANPRWIRGMMQHGFRGGAEIAATLDHLGAFAHLAGAVPPQLFDLYHDATLGNDDVRDFLARENPEALAAMIARFVALHDAGLWVTRRNSILAGLMHD
ncbi:cobaltochelatase subunit CobN [Roseinatronobacter alkalisoli]|uniref:Cobaltochelatase subunit CobN n=1 Tax=Roseinatronobacter alkalisoli TaxID=3028235 RepID=A0ABT5T6P8_9RHOB|nr:cobaltochelatase subunit CobN [Roseinatronobacter sp. HJB301]MDD7970783.1 cobaltochelatase subunit CobN [Roseinatronobacter sp. HJB301]